MSHIRMSSPTVRASIFFITALATGATLGDAALAAADHDPAFDLAATLAQLFRKQAFAAIIPSTI